MAAVLAIDDKFFFTDFQPEADVLSFFSPRGDNQILRLELLAIALGLVTFGNSLRDRSIRVFSYNVGSEHAARRGSARSFDHGCIVHSLWKRSLHLKAPLWIERVPTKENLADLPSREKYELLHAMGAIWLPPILDDEFRSPGAWRSISLGCA